MLADKDRIFTNLYGFHDWRLAAAQTGLLHLVDDGVGAAAVQASRRVSSGRSCRKR